MPALVLFGRRWQIGSDDLVLPSFIDLIFRIAWVTVATLTYWRDESNFDCTGGQVLKTYFYLNFISLHLAIVTDLAIFHSSRAGSIMNVQPRKLIPVFLYIRLTLHIADLILQAGGAACIVNEIFGCKQVDSSISLATRIIISNLVLVGIVAFSVLLTFDPLGTTLQISEYGTLENELPPKTKNTKIWELRCKLLACMYTNKDTNIRASFEECGKIIGAGFQDVDLVPSDVTAALVLLFMQNKQNSETLQTVVTESNSKANIVVSQPVAVTFSSSEQWDSPKLMHHFLKYGAAGYTTLAVYFARKNPLKRLWKNAVCCICFPGRQHPVRSLEGDNCCACHTSAIKDIIENDLENIIHASYKNDYFRSPFFVAVDHQTRSIVLSIRPSLSFKDFITDLTCWPVYMDIPGLPSNFMCHHGVKLSATILKAKLEALNVLGKLGTKYPDYNLVLTGDSLGAATAVVLGMMIRAQYPALKVYAYSPPGGLLSKEAAEYCNDFVTSITYGDDLIARMSILACQELKYSMLEALNKSDLPKYQILLRCCWLTMGGNSTLRNSVEKNSEVHAKNNMANPRYRQSSDGFHCISLFPPGKILHITEIDSSVKSQGQNYSGTRRWQYRWAERSEFGKFVISPRMILDHFPFRMLKALEYLTRLDS